MEEPIKEKPLLSYLISGSLQVNPRTDKSHLMLLDRVRALGGERDIVPCCGGWLLRHPRRYLAIPWIRTAVEEWDNQLKMPLGNQSSTTLPRG